MDIDHLPPHQLSSDSTLSSWTLYPEQVFDYAEHAQAGGSYVAPHHVNEEQHGYQQIQYGHCQDAYESPQHSDLPPADTAMAYWPTTAHVPPTSTTTPPMGSLYYFPSRSYHGDHDLSSTELQYNATPVDQFQSTPHAAYAESFGAAGYPDVSPSTTSESGHDLMPQDTTAHSALCEGAATFQTTDTSYAEMGLYEDAYSTSTGEAERQYAPVLAEEQQQPYVTAYAPVTQCQYVAPVSPSPSPPPEELLAPVPAPSSAPLSGLKRKASSRGQSPMGHLPYREDIVRTGTKTRRSSVFSGLSSSPSSTPRPPSPVIQTLTFITYPDLEPKGHGRGGDYDDDDDDDGSPRRGRRGKKAPKKEPFLACFFCRGRKIACHPRTDGGEDRTCTQCSKRHLECKYPHTSRRGQRKPQDPAAAAAAAAAATACKPRAVRASSKRSASSFVRI